MDMVPLIARFYESIADDARISSTHISVYMALLHTQNLNGGINPIAVKRDLIMIKAKILARQTYNKCMNELHNYGYILYEPATNGSVCSRVSLIKQELKQ